MNEFGNRIKALRLEHELTMEMMCADINQRYGLKNPLNRGMISKWESGVHDPTLENAKYLSMYFNVSLDYLIGLTDTRTPSRLLALAKSPEVPVLNHPRGTLIERTSPRPGINLNNLNRSNTTTNDDDFEFDFLNLDDDDDKKRKKP